MADKIGEGFSFNSFRNTSSIAHYKRALDLFSEGFSAATKLQNEIPIFVDTNVLLRYYSVSYKARKDLLHFFAENKKRIFVTAQVQKEFTKNREDVINQYLEKVTNKLPRDFSSTVINHIEEFLNQNNVILKDYSSIEESLKKINVQCEQLQEQLGKEIEDRITENKLLVSQDDFLKVLADCNLLDDIDGKEKDFLIKEFNELKRQVDLAKIDSELVKPYMAFPGLGDIKEKPSDPYGDYIIFHELLRYVKKHQRDVVFLTYDTAKGDWLTKKKLPHFHYVENSLRNTGKLIYILDAERVLDEIVKVPLESLLPTLEDILSENSGSGSDGILTKGDLIDYMNSNPIFGSRVNMPVKFLDVLFDELVMNSYSGIPQIHNILTKVMPAVLQYEEDNSTLSKIGVIRIGLKIANPNYISQSGSKSGKELNAKYFNSIYIS